MHRKRNPPILWNHRIFSGRQGLRMHCQKSWILSHICNRKVRSFHRQSWTERHRIRHHLYSIDSLYAIRFLLSLHRSSRLESSLNHSFSSQAGKMCSHTDTDVRFQFPEPVSSLNHQVYPVPIQAAGYLSSGTSDFPRYLP